MKNKLYLELEECFNKTPDRKEYIKYLKRQLKFVKGMSEEEFDEFFCRIK